MPKIKFVKENKTIEVPAGANLRKAALKEGVNLYPGVHKNWFANCHGFGNCASCAVHVKKGQENVTRQGLFEKLRLMLGPITGFARIGHETELRLACQTRVNGDVEIETQPSMNWHGDRFWG
jgi:ferredoxin